eukprot:9760606-Alexandrium_andersonii.AAC.1
MSISGSLALYAQSSDFGKANLARWFAIASRRGEAAKRGARVWHKVQAYAERAKPMRPRIRGQTFVRARAGPVLHSSQA